MSSKFPVLDGLGVDNVLPQWRATSPTADKMAQFGEANGLLCVGQELITWTTRRVLIDCNSVVVRKGATGARDRVVVRNPDFMKEAAHLSRVSRIYELSGQSK